MPRETAQACGRQVLVIAYDAVAGLEGAAAVTRGPARFGFVRKPGAAGAAGRRTRLVGCANRVFFLCGQVHAAWTASDAFTRLKAMLRQNGLSSMTPGEREISPSWGHRTGRDENQRANASAVLAASLPRLMLEAGCRR